MIDADNVESTRLKTAEAILKAEQLRDVWEARKVAKLMLPAAPAVVVWEETIRLLGKSELYRQQVEAELVKLESGS